MKILTDKFSIAIEGIDGSGKRTLAENIETKFKEEFSNDVEIMSFPRHKEEFSGELVDKFLYEGLKFEDNKFKPFREGILYSIDRMVSLARIRDNGKSKIQELNNGKIFIYDRYISSNFIHRCNKEETNLIQYITAMEYIEYLFMGLPEPNLTFILSVKPEISYKNIIERGRKTDENESLENLKKSYKRLKELSEIQNYIMIDCCKKNEDGNYEMKSREEITNEVWSYIVNYLTK